MTNLFGFLALSIALYAISKKNVVELRWWHLISSFLYIIYGYMIQAYPVIIGAVLYCGIHIFQLYQIKKTTSND